MSGDSRFVSGTAQSQLMTSLMEYGSIKSEPLHALLAATHAQSRSTWQHFDDASLAWQQHASDDITNKGFLPWRWHSELPPFDSCMTTLNKTVGGQSPSASSGQHTGNDQQQHQQQSQHHQSWAASVYGGPRLWPSMSYVDYDNGFYQRQPTCSTYGLTGASNGELPLTSSLSNYPPADSTKQSYTPIVDGGNCVENAAGSNRSPSTSAAAMAAAARMQAVARYFNDRWYSSAATGYGPTHPCFDSGNGASLSGGGGGGNRMPNGSADDTPSLLYASMAGRQSMAASSSSSTSISGLQQPGCPSAIGGLAACGPLLPPSDVTSYPFSSRWMWNGAPATCAVNANYTLNNCSQLPAGNDLHNKHSTSIIPDFYEDVKNDFRYLSPAVGGGLTGIPYAEMADGGAHGSDRKLSPETKKRRVTDAGIETRHPHSVANSMTSSSSTTATTATTTQRAPRQVATGATSASGGGTRSAASACECPNCREADRIGGSAGEQLRRIGQHSCHVPGCGKVYSKTSHLKAHLHWHNAGSTVISNGNSGNGARESPSSSTCSKPNPVGDQRHLSANGGECRSQSDRLVTSSKRSRKKSRTETSSGKSDVPRNNSTSAYLGQYVSTEYPGTASCRTSRSVPNETVFDNKLSASQPGGRYDRVTGTGSSPTTDDDIKRSQRKLLKQSPDSDANMLRKQDLFECRRSSLINSDDLLPVSNRTKSGAGSSVGTGSSACSSDRLAVLTANG